MFPKFIEGGLYSGGRIYGLIFAMLIGFKWYLGGHIFGRGRINGILLYIKILRGQSVFHSISFLGKFVQKKIKIVCEDEI